MPLATRPATSTDLPQIVALLLKGASRRYAHNPALWPIAQDAAAATEAALAGALASPDQPLRQGWLVAEAAATLVGVIHTMRLPVPPIYAGNWGDPGLMLADHYVADAAPPGTMNALIAAAEADLAASGARLLLAAALPGDSWHDRLSARGYQPLTHYLARTGFVDTPAPPTVRPATEGDVTAIVTHSARNRSILAALDPFWASHPEADSRFASWMKRSLSLPDRDMLVEGADSVAGYVIAQPASRLHIPPAHALASTGFIDDFFHADFSDPATMHHDGTGASALLAQAEAVFARRGFTTALVVCPTAWATKRAVLQRAGYAPALQWMIQR
jgi:hypothetical protein